MKVTPLMINVLMRAYYTDGNASQDRIDIDSAAYREVVSELEQNMIIHPTANYPVLSNLGRAWVCEILRTPIPRMVYLNSNDEVIDYD
jgi:hypothetical protein